MAKHKELKPGEWQYTVGEVPYQLTAYERADRGLKVYTRIWDGVKIGDKKMLCAPIRDATGRIDPEREIAAQTAAVARQKAKAAGKDDEDTSGPITLAVGFRLLLDAKKGKYAGKTEWRAEVERYTRPILEHLDAGMLWADLKHRHYRQLWRELARKHVGEGKYGLRTAEMIVGVLQSATRWLQVEEHVEPGTALPAPDWVQSLREEWQTITKQPPKEKFQPRFTREETETIFANLHVAEARLALAIELGAENRLGQVVERTRRSDIFAHRGFRIGGVHIHGKGKKRGGKIIFTMAQRHAVTRAMIRGYLCDLEQAYRNREIDDYYLFPGGYLTTNKGKLPWPRVKVEDADHPHTAMRKAWKRFQAAIGVEEVKKRNWYGLRRRLADDAEDRAEGKEKDPRVLNALGHWTHTQTREGYQQQGRSEILELAAQVREKARPKSKRRKNIRDNREGKR